MNSIFWSTLSGFQSLLLIIVTVCQISVAAPIEEKPLQHKLNEYVTREGHWSSIYQLSSMTTGGNETFPRNSSDYVLTYVDRVKWGNEIIPAKFHDDRQNTYFIYQDKEVDCSSCDHQFLYNEPYFQWVARQNGDICNGAIVGGISTSFEKYYICQFNYYDQTYENSELINGKLIPSLGECQASRFGKQSSPVYNVLRDSRFA